MNLTAITEMEDVVTKHFVDSLSLVKSSKKIWKQQSIGFWIWERGQDFRGFL